MNIISCFFEITMLLFCLHTVFNTKWRLGILDILIIIFDIAIMLMVNGGVLSIFGIVWVYFILFIYCMTKFKKSVIASVGYFGLGILISILIEVVTSFMGIRIAREVQSGEIVMLLMSICSCIFSIVIYWKALKERKKFQTEIPGAKWESIIIVCGATIVFMITDYHYRGKIEPLYYSFLLVLCVMISMGSIRMQRIKYELEKKELEQQMQEVYGVAYEELVKEARHRQHDFANQLGAIYSMHLTATSLEDLVEKQSKYGNVVLEECRYDKILSSCNNSILAGYLYYKCVELERRNIRVDYKICVDEASCNMSLHELIEILGILINNAAEHIEKRIEYKCIDLLVLETPECLMIGVSNRAELFTSDKIRDMFSLGYSTKGKRRGMGLPRIKELVEKYKAKLIVKNIEKDNENWINFKIVISK